MGKKEKIFPINTVGGKIQYKVNPFVKTLFKKN